VRAALTGMIFLLLTAVAAAAQTVVGLSATGGLGRSTVALRFDGPAPAPLAVATLADPPRLALDLPRVAWAVSAPPGAGLAAGLRFGLAAPDRSRLVIDLAAPALPAGLTREGGTLTLALRAVDPAAFAQASRPPPSATRAAAPGPLRVALDAGHGGRDPGAVAGGLLEKDVVLAHAEALAAALRRRGATVVRIRQGDVFMPLWARVAAAQAAEADALISLHADSAPQPELSGASVYTLSPVASDLRAVAFAARENGADGAAATAFPTAGRDVAAMLTALARGATEARSRSLGRALAEAFTQTGVALPSRPLRAAPLAVLRAPEVPSVLVELGFMSSAEDRRRLTDPAWRDAIAEAVADAILRWDAANASEFSR